MRALFLALRYPIVRFDVARQHVGGGAAGGCLFVTLLPVCRVTFVSGRHGGFFLFFYLFTLPPLLFKTRNSIWAS